MFVNSGITRRQFLAMSLGALVTHAVSRTSTACAQSQDALLSPVTQVPLPSARIGEVRFDLHATGMWARDNLAVVANAWLINLIEFSDPRNPQLVTIDIFADTQGDCRDADFYQNYLLCGLVSAADNRRVLIYDISDWDKPQLVATVRSTDYRTVHTLFVAGKVCFLATTGGRRDPGELHLLDISDAANPVALGPVRFPDRRMTNVHDVTVIGNRAYVAALNNGFWVIDFENLDDPQRLSYRFVAQHVYEPADPGRRFPVTHNVWPSPDGKLLFATDEDLGEFVRIFDISDMNQIKLLGQYGLGPNAIPHNVVIDGTMAYVAHYAHGIRAFEFSNPEQPREVAVFDPYQGASRDLSGYDGFWDVYPFAPYVLGSDMQSGLWILEKSEV